MAINKKISIKIDKKLKEANDSKGDKFIYEDKKIEETNNSKDDKFIYEDKIPISYLLSSESKSLTNILLCIHFILSIPFLVCIRLVQPGTKNLFNLFEFKLRKIEINYIELKVIKRLLMGLHTSTNNHNQSENV
ncbi:hypothetical protein F8M41_013302 [Gigaspora margarita]|uniref:Uncharacterized protein n=1 Tax=Gigaspora margarita TaxID=4874 RepID=A0A8H4B3W8_GIGMA|nr:hypothetical protein F8M41_013302 [Gigaspora margarita]